MWEQTNNTSIEISFTVLNKCFARIKEIQYCYLAEEGEGERESFPSSFMQSGVAVLKQDISLLWSYYISRAATGYFIVIIISYLSCCNRIFHCYHHDHIFHAETGYFIYFIVIFPALQQGFIIINDHIIFLVLTGYFILFIISHFFCCKRIHSPPQSRSSYLPRWFCILINQKIQQFFCARGEFLVLGVFPF